MFRFKVALTESWVTILPDQPQVPRGQRLDTVRVVPERSREKSREIKLGWRSYVTSETVRNIQSVRNKQEGPPGAGVGSKLLHLYEVVWGSRVSEEHGVSYVTIAVMVMFRGEVIINNTGKKREAVVTENNIHTVSVWYPTALINLYEEGRSVQMLPWLQNFNSFFLRSYRRCFTSIFLFPRKTNAIKIPVVISYKKESYRIREC